MLQAILNNSNNMKQISSQSALSSCFLFDASQFRFGFFFAGFRVPR